MKKDYNFRERYLAILGEIIKRQRFKETKTLVREKENFQEREVKGKDRERKINRGERKNSFIKMKVREKDTKNHLLFPFSNFL